MPQSFSWSLASVTPVGNALPPVGQGGTSVYYAVTRALDPGTGDIVMAGPTWARGQPATEIVLRCLRTPRGRYIPDPTYGLDYSVLQKATSDKPSKLRAAIQDALSRFAKRGVIEPPQIAVQMAGAAVQADVTFVDPRAQQQVALAGRG